MITVAPSAGPIGSLLRTAIDAEQVGAARLHLAADQPDLSLALSALREQTQLFLTCDSTVHGADEVGSDFVDVVLDDNPDRPALVAEVARLVTANPAGVAVSGRGSAALPVLLAALAAGGHLWVAAPEHEAATVAPPPFAARPKDHVALIARACGLARIAGRLPLDRPAAARLLGLAAAPTDSDSDS